MKSKKNEHALGIFVLSLVLVLPFAAWYGFAISTLWRWFVVPLGVVPVGVWSGAGLCILVRLLTMDTTLPREDDRSLVERVASSLTLGVLAPALSLAFGALYHAFA